MKGFLVICACVQVWAYSQTQPSVPVLTDQAASMGLQFNHFNGMVGALHIVETMGAGCALLDYDNDGDLDVYLVQGNLLGDGATIKDSVFPPPGPLPLRDRLFRNDLGSDEQGNPKPKFVDVTETSGIAALGYGMGVAVSDFDRDGWLDLYITNFGPNQLWRNNGDGTFSDVTQRSGSDDSRWSVSAAFVDYDLDGWQDLYIANYIDFTYKNHKVCPTKYGTDDYCGPSAYQDSPDRLLRNTGDGRFEDVTLAAGIQGQFGAGLGVVAADFDGDHWPDVYVANDADHNLLWMNKRDGSFRNDALLAGCAVNADGAPEASMGVDSEDFDGDGDLDLFMTHLTGETHTLYVNDGSAFFEDGSQGAGLGMASTKKATGFGTGWFDYDNDGRLDLLVVNGNVFSIESLRRAKDPYPLHQPNQLFWNRGGGAFIEVSDRAGPAFRHSEVSRGAAFGDVDNDGDVDVLITNNNGPVRLLMNGSGNRNSWLGINLKAGSKGKPVEGATLCLVGQGNEPPICRRVRRAASYASSNDVRVVFGLKGRKGTVSIQAIYAGGYREQWTGVEMGGYVSLVMGSGNPIP